MTLLVRDEHDIVEANLRYHLNRGVDFVIAVDNGSRDGTLDILRRYEQAGLLHLIQEEARDVRRLQSCWLTRAARQAAAEFGADWVIHADADEFWWPVQGTLEDVLGGIPASCDGVTVPRTDFLLAPGEDEPCFERMVVREARSRNTPKVAHRAFPDILVSGGSHRAAREAGRPDPPSQALRLRQALEAGDVEDLRSAQGRKLVHALVCAPATSVRILHFPLRSRAHLGRKVEQALRPGGFMAGYATAANRPTQSGGVPEPVYAHLVADGAAVERGIGEGWLVADTRLRDFLGQCPDPLAATAARAGLRSLPSPRLGEDELRSERAAIGLDVMHALARAQDASTEGGRRTRRRKERKRQLARELKESRGLLRAAERGRHHAERRAQALSRRLAAVEASRWWRLRALAARIGARPGAWPRRRRH